MVEAEPIRSENNFCSFAEKHCRTCLIENELMVSVLDPVDVLNKNEHINKILEEFVLTEVSINDIFPKKICISCAKKLQEVYEFKEMCKQSALKFTKMVTLYNSNLQNNFRNTVCSYDENKANSRNDLEKHNEVNDLKVLIDGFERTEEEGVDDVDDSSFNISDKNQETKSDEPHPCPICSKIFYSKYNMHRHKKIHTDCDELRCEICQKQFSRRADVKRHMLVHNGEKPHICPVCNTSFSQTGALSRHKRLHEEFKNIPYFKKRVDIKPHLCMICGKSFKMSSSLTTHMRRHLGEKSYRCTICEMSFVCRSSLNGHMRIHTGERPFICAICGKNFSHSSVLSRHMKIHENLKPYMCDVCPKTFSTKYYLNIHKRQHTGEKPYKCTMCMKLFADPKNFKHHMKIHMESKPYLCTVCGKGFRRKHHLTAHMGIHSK